MANTKINSTKTSIFERNSRLTLAFLFVLIGLVTDFSVAAIFMRDQKTDDLRFRAEHHFFHHTLLPNVDCEDIWFDTVYYMTTDSLGFKGSNISEEEGRNFSKKVLLLGDSFTEGVGVSYPETFAGLLSARSNQVKVLNAGVVSYSPKLYFLKAKYLLEKKKFHFDELVVFLDISDLQDEIVYEKFAPSQIDPLPPSWLKRWWGKTYVFLINNSVIWNRIHRFTVSRKPPSSEPFLAAKKFGYKDFDKFWEVRDDWTVDSTTWQRWGAEGLKLAKANMEQLNSLCLQHDIKLTLVTYPWPKQIQRNEIKCPHISIWEEFAEEHGIRCINLFPDFLNQNSSIVLKEFFIPGDVHWNKKGHLLVAESLLSKNIFE